MKLSLRALKSWVDFGGSGSELAAILADLGFPNDGVTTVGEGLKNVVVGQILTKAKHLQADRLSVLTVDIGSEILPIVCGAQNMKAEDFVALAPVGAKIPGKDGAGLLMKEAKIRGEISKGMCCSEAELGLPSDSDGILLLPKEKVSTKDLGKRVSEVLDLDDSILEIDITPNRGDALSIRGLARELAAKLGLRLKVLTPFKWRNPVSTVNPSIESFEDASGFAACLVQGVTYGPGLEEWKNFLSIFGARSLSNLVDVTNIVLFELGHPIHFFDADKIDSLTVGVRRAKPGERLELLNGRTIELHSEDLVIADKSGPLSLAGIMGGQAASVSETTKNVLIEVAAFDPRRIRESARRHSLHSESSQRFERGVTAFDLDEVMDRALTLLKEVSGFEMAAGTKTLDRALSQKSVLWDRARIESKLGRIQKSDDELFELLRRLEYTFEPKGSTVRVLFPWYRTDVGYLEDVMEDIGRLLGYEHLERKGLVAFESKHLLKDFSEKIQAMDRLLESFVGFGFSEVVHSSFSNPDLEKKLGYTGLDFVRLENPIHSEKSVLRRHLLPELLMRAKWNAEHGEDEVRLVEMGPVYSNASSGSIYDDSPMRERLSIACVWYPRAVDKKRLWHASTDFYFEFKGVVESVWKKWSLRPARDLELPRFHPGRLIEWKNGCAGELHPLQMKALDLTGRCFVGEWVVEVEASKVQYSQPAIYPAIDLDASFVCKTELSVGEFLTEFDRTKAPFLEWVRPYDIFQSEELKPHKKSVTFAMRYRSLERTLTLEEAKKSHDHLVSSVLASLSQFEIALR